MRSVFVSTWRCAFWPQKDSEKLALPQPCGAQEILLNEFAPFSREMTQIKITEQVPLADVCVYDLA